ncbi:MAG TPA: biopolymer transporter ExbD [Candidatus Limnocylindria bacterium]|jgi:biopolymer transport protein ExbD|nr:biopolymer transporter ExbD [Candidatus Limnocylindria bacterium]
MAGGGSSHSPGGRKKARIEIIPLIDVMFFLLASFMMVSLSMQKLQVIKMDLPTATKQTSSKKPDVFNIEISRTGDVSVDSKHLSMPEMEQSLKERMRSNTNLPVYIKADQKSTHGMVMNVLDAVKAVGAEKVSFAIEAPKN